MTWLVLAWSLFLYLTSTQHTVKCNGVYHHQNMKEQPAGIDIPTSSNICAMALGGEDSDVPFKETEVDPETFLKSLVHFDKHALINLIKDMYHETIRCQNEIDKLEDEFHDFKTHVAAKKESSVPKSSSSMDKSLLVDTRMDVGYIRK